MRVTIVLTILVGLASGASADPATPIGAARSTPVGMAGALAGPGRGDVVSASSLRRVSRGLQDREHQPGTLRGVAITLQVFGAAPRPSVLGDVDLSPLAPAVFGPPSHLEWLRGVTPVPFRTSLLWQPLRPRTGW